MMVLWVGRRARPGSPPCTLGDALDGENCEQSGQGTGRDRRPPFHYGWIVAGVTFVVLLVTAGIRATPGILMVPLEAEFGWNRAVISAAVAINIALFGLIGPFAASVMDRWGLRRDHPGRASRCSRCRSR